MSFAEILLNRVSVIFTRFGKTFASGGSTARRRRCAAPGVREKLAGFGIDPMPMSPGELGAHVEREVALNGALAQKAGLKAE